MTTLNGKKYSVEELRKIPLKELKRLVYKSTVHQFSSICISLEAGWSCAHTFRDYNKKRSYAKRKMLVEKWYGESAPHEMGEREPID